MEAILFAVSFSAIMTILCYLRLDTEENINKMNIEIRHLRDRLCLLESDGKRG